jgi:DNA-directed RNA polymerase subunit alpha
MSLIPFPQKPKFTEVDQFTGKFEINGCYPGYGTTLGNALRRVLLSSLEGAAITSVKIKGVSHEFSTIPGVLEDAVHMILNLKKVRFRMYSEEPMKVSLKSKGEGVVKAGDFKCSSEIEVINPEQVIATITDKKTNLEMEIEVSRGLGYVPVEQQKRENKEIGVIAIDAIYTPIVRVNYNVEDMRVGKRTDYSKITLEITTDGSISPKEAIAKAVEILVNQFSALAGFEENVAPEVKVAEIVEEKVAEEVNEVADPMKIKVEDLKGLSARTLKSLTEGGILKVKDIVKMKEEELLEVKGMGEKGAKEIKKAIGELGSTLKQ